MEKLTELTLLVWLSQGNKERLIKMLSQYTGSEEEVYTDKVLIRIIEDAIADITRKYHIKHLMYTYLEAKRRWEDYAAFYPKRYTYSEIDPLRVVVDSIPKWTFFPEDLEIIDELKNYFKKVEIIDELQTNLKKSLVLIFTND